MTVRDWRWAIVGVGLHIAVATTAHGDANAPLRLLEQAGWPADTSVVSVIAAAVHIRADAAVGAEVLGKVMGGTRLSLLGVRSGDRRCPIWANVSNSGWICASALAPSGDPVGGERFPRLREGAILPGDYFQVGEGGAWSYEDERAITESTDTRELAPKTILLSRTQVEVDGRQFRATNRGLVAADQLEPVTPSQWVGLPTQVAPLPAGAIGITIGASRDDTIAVRDRPADGADEVRRIARRKIVTVLKEEPGWLQIGEDEWVKRSRVRMVRMSPPPAGVGEQAQWIDIDLDEQTLVAYHGNKPHYLTLVSTGRRIGSTPEGIYRIRAKAATTRMASEAATAGAENSYDVSAVPWAMRFRRGLFLHTAYWHDDFGTPRSRGCINLSPRDARFLFEWVHPALPDGWSELEVPSEGVVVRVRSRRQPSPRWHDYAREERRKASSPRLPTWTTPSR